jgi:hypothetical protein
VVVVERSKISSPCVNIGDAGNGDASAGAGDAAGAGAGADSWSESVIVMAGGVDYDGEPMMLG